MKEERKPHSERKANEENKLGMKGGKSKINSNREKKKERKKGVRGIEYLYFASLNSYMY